MHDKFPELNLPAAPLKIEGDGRGGFRVFDVLRRRAVALTPEEWVRQNFVYFLISEREFPPQFMANEVALTLNGTSRRADTMVYTRGLRPLVVVEYKAPEITVGQKVFDQIARYNSVMQAPFLIVSNGMHHYCCRYGAEGAYRFLPDIPTYAEMLACVK